ncbi:MAG: beta strand repeat-containing protein, partial [Bacteroidales bacterium]
MEKNSLCYKNYHFGLAKAILLSFLLLILFVQNAKAAEPPANRTVGTTGANYATLKAAFDAINAGTLTGAVTLQIIDNTTETVQPELKASGTGAANYTSVVIYPTISGKTIYGNFAGANVFLNGADNVTIDGRVNRTGTTVDLTIANDIRFALRLYDGATNNTIRYCTLKGSYGSATFGGVIQFDGEYGGAGNSDNIIEYNNITSTAAGLTCVAIYSAGRASGPVLNSNNIVRYNNIYDIWKGNAGSYGIRLGEYNAGWSVTGNSFYQTQPVTVNSDYVYGIYVDINTSNFTINNNYIGGTSPECGGTPLTTSGVNNLSFRGIQISASGNNEIQGNTISNILWTSSGSGQFIAMSLGNGNYNCGTSQGNTIGSASGTGSILFTGGNSTGFMGIYFFQIANDKTINCKNNTIGSITTANSDPTKSNYFIGIQTWNNVAGNITISNNAIGSADTPNSIFVSSPSTGANQSLRGTFCRSTGANVISGNTIGNLTNAQSTFNASNTSGIYITGGANTITNNVIHDLKTAASCSNQPVSGNTSAISGIYLYNTAEQVQSIKGNTLYNLSSSYESFSGYVVGISYEGGIAESSISENYIYNLFVTGASSTDGNISGIFAYKGVVTLSNNIVSLGGNTTTNAKGIYINGSISNDNIRAYFNTVHIGGTLASGSGNYSYCLHSGSEYGLSKDYRNNVLDNTRSTAGTVAKHFAIYYQNPGGTFVANNNDYHVTGTGGMLGYYGANKSTLADLQAATGQDAQSLNTDPVFASA